MTALVVCDLDGTLLRPDATLSPFARDGLNTLLSTGTALTVASARSLPAIRALLRGVDLTLPIIELNGAYLSDPQTGAHLSMNSVLDPSPAVELLLSSDLPPVLTTFDGTRDNVWFDPAGASTWFIEEKRRYNDPRLRLGSDLLAVCRSEQVALITVFVPDSQALTLATELRAVTCSATVTATRHEYSPGLTEIGIQSPQSNKGTAVDELRTLLGLTGQLTVCGDHLNDLPMFAVADLTVAPANAHPSVLATASVVTEPNDTDGIVRYLLASALT